MIRITSLSDHRGCPGFCTDFGLALYVEAYGERIPFDTGAGSALIPNAERAGIGLASVTRIVLSHGHYDHTCTVGNTIPEEQALLLKDGILVTGCCHAGIINTVEACCAARPDISVRVIAGGLHLMHAGETRLKATADYLAALGLEKLILMHSTGETAERYMTEHLDCKVVTGFAGTVCYEGE